MTLATIARNRRKELNLTQRDAAELSGVSERFVREVESGKQTLRLDKITALFETLGLELTPQVKS